MSKVPEDVGSKLDALNEAVSEVREAFLELERARRSGLGAKATRPASDWYADAFEDLVTAAAVLSQSLRSTPGTAARRAKRARKAARAVKP